MPTLMKTLYFVSSAVVTAIGVAILGYGMSAQWSQTTLDCSRLVDDNFNGTAVVRLALFLGTVEREFCPIFGGDASFTVFSQLLEQGGAPVILQGFTYGLLALCLLFSAASILLAIYNSVSNPYETILGPTGIYVCNSLSACLSFLAIILYLSNVLATDVAENIVSSYTEIEAQYRNRRTVVDVGFCLVIPYTVLSLVSIALIYFYDHAAYTQRKEQQRPTEDAPKEIMMY